mmetsp:Transcript_5342/g.6563  ORF Transcript_5342/g.6563 Transcript_5342/m.6563 type:complete len:91 (-) Transcript_5342:85-357(-)
MSVVRPEALSVALADRRFPFFYDLPAVGGPIFCVLMPLYVDELGVAHLTLAHIVALSEVAKRSECTYPALHFEHCGPLFLLLTKRLGCRC